MPSPATARKATARKHPPASTPPAEPLASATISTLELRDLVHCDLNVRRTDRDTGIVELAEDIATHGLLNNLVVIPVETSFGPKYGVIAGDRRLQALQLLLDDGRLPFDFPVPVRIDRVDNARQISLSENIHRVALNPADEYEAFAAIIADLDGDDPAARIRECARRQGVTVRRVEQALRLAELAPPLFEALRRGDLTIDAAKAYAMFADHEHQLAVFEANERRGYGTKHDPREIRDALKRRTYDASDPRALYVGLIAYHAEGGRSEPELLFGSEAGHERLLDPALLDRLVKEKAEAELPIAAKRDGLAGGLLARGFGAACTWPSAPKGYFRAWHQALDDLPRKQRGSAVGVYAVTTHGADARLCCVGYFKPYTEVKSETAVEEIATKRLAESSERLAAAEQRESALIWQAAHIAAPRLLSAIDSERLIWPAFTDWVDPIKELEDGTILVAVRLRLTRDEIDALMPDAERIVAGIEANAAEADAATPAEEAA